MSDPIEVVDNRPRNSEVVPVKESSVNAAWKNFECSTERKKSLQARYVYGFIFLLTNLLAWLIRDYGHKIFPKLYYLKACGVDGLECSRTNGVLRVSLGCCIFFFLMFLTTLKTRKLYEARNAWHSRWWTIKFVLMFISLTIPFFCPSFFIQYYGEVARIGAGIFLLLQLVSVIQFITWWNNYWMPDSKLKQTSILGLFMSTIFYIASTCGLVLMYLLYARRLSCTLNLFFITWTVILFIVMMLISLHSKVNRGLLSSGIMASYIIFLCWSAIRSEPSNSKCSPASEMAGKGDWTTVLGFLFAICAIVMATFSTGIDSQSFQFQRNEVEWEDDIPYKYEFFHAVFSLGAMYFAMLFISWQLDHSTKKWSIDVGWASTWVKIVNEWFAATIYCE
ncbi:hypothetical protein AQUCO_03400194v1 [Aquilegia coerulea]|uniref:Serine incorporator n=1 Tax=Aquilegia coerulea TaxID=218851 RepID=A0A2G5CXW5_AQUCA|nr:hypothetical protein AQUCO_03400194v1 [Aquilegia coerulea]